MRRGGSLQPLGWLPLDATGWLPLNATGWLPLNAGVAPLDASPPALANAPQDDCPAHAKPKHKSGETYDAMKDNTKLHELGLIVDCRKKLKAPDFAPSTTAKRSGGRMVHPSFGLPA